MRPTAAVPARHLRRRRTPATLAVAAVAVACGIAATPGRATNRGTPGRIAIETQACLTPRLCLPGTRRPVALDPTTATTIRLDAAGTRLREPQYSADGTRLVGIDAATGLMTVTDATGADPRTSFGGQTYEPTSVGWGVYDLPAFTLKGQYWMADSPDGAYAPTYLFYGTARRLYGSVYVKADGLALNSVQTNGFDPVAPRRGVIAGWSESFPVTGCCLPLSPGRLPRGISEITTDVTVSGESQPQGLVLRTGRTSDGGYRTVLSTLRSEYDDDGLQRTTPVLERTAPDGPAITSATLSPDLRRIAFVSGGDLFTVALDGTDLRTLYDPRGRRVLGRISWQATDPAG